MLKAIYLFELKQGIRKPATYLFAGFLFAFSMLVGMISTGVLATYTHDSLMTVNSAYSIAEFLISTNSDVIGLIYSVVLITFAATAVQKDYQYQMHPFFFTSPISKAQYFFGRFFGGFTLCVLIFLCSLLGLYTGFIIGYGHPALGPFNVWNFVQPFLIFVLPNIFLLGIIYFSLTTFLRTTLAAYLLAIVLVVLQLATMLMLSNIDNKTLASMLEPTGRNAFIFATEYWTAAQKNTLLIPFKGEILYNRLLWLGIAGIITLISYWKFEFTQYLQPLNLWKKKPKESILILNKYESISDIPQPKIKLDIFSKVKRFFYLSWYEFKKIVRSPFYIIICILGVIITLLGFIFSSMWNSAETFPLTYLIIERIRSGFNFALIIFIVFYSGTIVWKEKEYKMDELLGVTFISNSGLYFSRFTATWWSVGIIWLIGIATGIILQLANGFWQIDLPQYFVFFCEAMIGSAIPLLLCIAIQSIFTNKYIGYFVSLIPTFFLFIIFSALKINNPLLQFNSSGEALPYSALNSYGDKHFVWATYKLYWLSIVSALSFIALMVFFRGKEKNLISRFILNRNNQRLNFIGFIVSTLIAIVLGVFISRENQKLNIQLNEKEMALLQIEYEKKYKQYETIAQPRVSAVFAQVDLFPSNKSMSAKFRYTLKNNSDKTIDTLFVNYMGMSDPKFHFKTIKPSTAYQVVEDDSTLGVCVIKIEPLAPGDSFYVDMELDYRQNSLFTHKETNIVKNGTFITKYYFLSFGYDPRIETNNNIFRKKNGLPAKNRTHSLEDSIALQTNYISNDGDWIQFECIISTDKDQIAIAPGYLQREWEEKNRKYFHYKMDSPIINFYAFQSARYKVSRDRWQDVDIEVYYHPTHDYNIAEMINSVKASLEYYSRAFGPYQHRQVRIIEFPRYGSYAQSFPNTIPYSEDVGFLTKPPKNADEINMPFYITAHEVAHQWWAHQVIGGNVQGSEMLSESLSQYAALMVMEKQYGRSAMRKFLKHELNDYLRFRTFETKREVPIARVEHQGYIFYNKGSLIFYALRDYLGEETLNIALRNYLNKYKFQGPPYSRSIDLINCIAEATPDSLKYLIDDFFFKITLYENYIKSLDCTPLNDGKYAVTATIGTAKFYADESGKEIRAPFQTEYINVGIFGTDAQGKEQEIFFGKVKMDQPEKTFSWIVDHKPTSIGVDPYYYLIDRRIGNNVVKFGSEPEAPLLSEEKTVNISITR